MTEVFLLLWLEAPLQSWGSDSRFGRRETLPFPSKSGVLGLLCCALGRGGPQKEWLKAWADQDFEVISYPRKQSGPSPSPPPPLLRDFHMVGSHYSDKDLWETLMIPKTEEGKKAVGGGSKMTYRYYLQDMAFAVLLQGPRELVDEAAQGLQAPVWDLYLGRKTCAPTELIFQGVFLSREEAHLRAQELAAGKGRVADLRIRQGEYDGEVWTLNDVPLQFGPRKLYRDRKVTLSPASGDE